MTGRPNQFMQVLADTAGFTISCKQKGCENVKKAERTSTRVAGTEATHPDVNDLGVAHGRGDDRKLLGLKHGDERIRILSMAKHWSHSSGRKATCYHSDDMGITDTSTASKIFSALPFFSPLMSMYHSGDSKEKHQETNRRNSSNKPNI